MAKYKVIRYDQAGDFHEIIDGKGGSFFVDLLVDASFNDYPSGTISEKTGISKIDVCNEIVGKEIEMEEMFPYCYIGQNIKIVNP